MLPVVDFLILQDAFFIGCKEFTVETVELLLHEEFRFVRLVADAVVVNFEGELVFDLLDL
jgi:hypothetical protein